MVRDSKRQSCECLETANYSCLLIFGTRFLTACNSSSITSTSAYHSVDCAMLASYGQGSLESGSNMDTGLMILELSISTKGSPIPS
uniref:Ovule protein n=1 Tax=Heterorhabditis bacteriophora TaxID=37862 RepID=A0A1I7XDC9_HETBA